MHQYCCGIPAGTVARLYWTAGTFGSLGSIYQTSANSSFQLRSNAPLLICLSLDLLAASTRSRSTD